MNKDTKKLAEQISQLETEEAALEALAGDAVRYETTEAAFQQQEVIELAGKSLDYLSALAAPDVHKYNYPPTLQAAWSWLLTYIHKHRDFSKLALGLPRGFAKTALMKLFILYVILYTDRRFILVIAANAKLAQNIVAR